VVLKQWAVGATPLKAAAAIPLREVVAIPLKGVVAALLRVALEDKRKVDPAVKAELLRPVGFNSHVGALISITFGM